MNIRELIDLYIKASEEVKNQADLLLEANQSPAEPLDLQPSNS